MTQSELLQSDGEPARGRQSEQQHSGSAATWAAADHGAACVRGRVGGCEINTKQRICAWHPTQWQNGSSVRERADGRGSGLAVGSHSSRRQTSPIHNAPPCRLLQPCSRTGTIARISACSSSNSLLSRSPFADAMRWRGEWAETESQSSGASQTRAAGRIWGAAQRRRCAQQVDFAVFLLPVPASLRLTVVCAAVCCCCCWLLLVVLSAVCSARQTDWPAAQKKKRKSQRKKKRNPTKETDVRTEKKSDAHGSHCRRRRGERDGKQEKGNEGESQRACTWSARSPHCPAARCCASPRCSLLRAHFPSAFIRTASQPTTSRAFTSVDQHTHHTFTSFPAATTSSHGEPTAHTHTRPLLCRRCRRFFPSSPRSHLACVFS